MKLEKMSDRRGVAKNPPRRTTDELADELGIDVMLLRFHLSHDESAPKCVLDNTSGHKVSSNRWFDRRAVLTWWKQRHEGVQA